MIIGIDTSRANRKNKTGVEWYSYYLIKELTALGSKHTFRLYFDTEPEPGLLNLGPNVQYRTLHWLPRYLWTQGRLSLEMLLDPPDALFVPAHAIPLIHPAATVNTVHDVAFKAYPETYRARSRWYLDRSTRWATKLPIVVTISAFSKKEMLKYYPFDPARIIVTPLGMEHTVTTTAPMVLTKFNIQQPYVLYVGRLERKKNVKTVIEAFTMIKATAWGDSFQLVLVGGRGYGWIEIESLINRSKYKHDIIITGYASEAEKHTLYSNASVYLHLSAYEGFGIPILEAFSAGVPVIASDRAAIPEVTGDAALLVYHTDAAAVARNIERIMSDSELRRTLIQRGSQRVQQFTWRRTAELTLGAIEQAARSV